MSGKEPSSKFGFTRGSEKLTSGFGDARNDGEQRLSLLFVRRISPGTDPELIGLGKPQQTGPHERLLSRPAIAACACAESFWL